MRALAIAGSTGSIGTQALEVVAAAPEEFSVVAIGANSDVASLARQAAEFHPEVVGLFDATRAKELAGLLPPSCQLVTGAEALSVIGTSGDVVLNGVVGFAGLSVTLSALSSGRMLALANKESLIAGGPVVQQARVTPGAMIVPVDSEHCAIHQCLAALAPANANTANVNTANTNTANANTANTANNGKKAVSRLLLTASGGPFFGRDKKSLATVTRKEALAHPTWSMGEKITIDSSTLMNKGLEVIEAHELFFIDYDEIEVLVHPQSIVHSMVECSDGATLAQLSRPDMRLAIGYGISYPKRLAVPFGKIDWSELHHLEFFPPDRTTFSCLELAYEVGATGGSAPAWLNAANEVAVGAFLAERIAWSEIPVVIEETLAHHDGAPLNEREDVLAADARARRLADKVVDQRACLV